MLGIGDGVHLIPVSLSRLRQENEWRRISGLQAECQIEQDEGIYVEIGEAEDVDGDPDGHEDALANQKDRRSKKAGKAFRLEGEPIVAKNSAEMQMRSMKSVEVICFRVAVCLGCFKTRCH